MKDNNNPNFLAANFSKNFIKDIKKEEKKYNASNVKKTTTRLVDPTNKALKQVTSKQLPQKENTNILTEDKTLLSERSSQPVNKIQFSMNHKSFSELDYSEYDDEWRNLNELVNNNNS